MPFLRHSCAGLRITGDSLDPDAISRLLGCSPTLGHVKGQIEPGKGKPIVRETGAWQLDAAGQQPGNLDAHVAELFRRVKNDLSAWATLSGEYKIDLFCVYFMRSRRGCGDVRRDVEDIGRSWDQARTSYLLARGGRRQLIVLAPWPDIGGNAFRVGTDRLG
jgi:hypothetical protein